MTQLDSSQAGVVSPKQDRPPRYRALIVEDHTTNQLLAQELLRRLGCECVAAVDGEQGVECWQRQAFDFVLMDLQMPVMDGFDATREIRRREGEGPHLPIIAVTASVHAADHQRCRDAGMDDCLIKPLTRSALIRALQPWFSFPPHPPLVATSVP